MTISNRYLTVLAALISFFCETRSSVLIRSDYHPTSNQLEHFHHYKKLTSNYNETFFADLDCHMEDHGDLKVCLLNQMVKAHSQSLFPPIWKSSMSEVVVGMKKRMEQQVDCTYDVPDGKQTSTVKNRTVYVNFVIVQSKCLSGTDVRGGASFHAIMSNEDFLAQCGVTDLFDNTYAVECRLPLIASVSASISKVSDVPTRNTVRMLPDLDVLDKGTGTTSSAATSSYGLKQCVRISVTMEHEHYDAFGREGGLPPGPIMLFHKVLKEHQICTVIPLQTDVIQEPTSSNISSNSSRNATSPRSLGATGSSGLEGLTVGTGPRFYEYLRGIWIRDRGASINSVFDNSVFKYAWSTSQRSSDAKEEDLNQLFINRHRQQNPVMSLSKEDYALCQSQQTNLLIGESHQRFTWSFLAYHYHEGQATYLKTLERKHGDVSFYRFNLTQKYFIPNMVHFLDRFQCPANTNSSDGSDRVAIALQMGTWDLSAAPLRVVLEISVYGVPALLGAVKRMQQRGCSSSVRLVIVQTMPYPSCNRDDDLCTHLQSWHNNWATAALLEHLRRELTKLENHYGDLRIVDSLGIMGANIDQYECINYFLCRHGEKQSYRVASTPAGEALASEMINALCDKRS